MKVLRNKPFNREDSFSQQVEEDDEYEEYSDDDWTAADSETGTLTKKVELTDRLPSIA